MATGTVKAAFFYNYFILYFIFILYFQIALSLYFEIPVRYQIKNRECLLRKSKEQKKLFTSLNLILIPTTISHCLGRAS